ncbi:G5 domain-containing protein [Psychrobacillus sp. FSL H8-0510]|uniref:G5 domain-containing protein n=1 Tax=Psychrobacillus sp. FSL H8-0510 TaxID=2921394 RepID=UPI0030FAF341
MKFIYKTFVLVVLMLVLVYLGTYQLTQSLQQVSANSENVNSSIAGIIVEDLKKEEIIDLLNSEIENWQQDSIHIIGNGTDIILSSEWFEFDVKGTVEEYLYRTNKPWFAFWESEPLVQMSLIVNLQEDLKHELQKSSHLNLEETLNNIKIAAENLSKEPIESVILDASILESERLAFSLVPASADLIGLPQIIEVLDETVLYSGGEISFNNFLNDSNIAYNDKTVDFIASALYSTVLSTNFQIIERHSQGIIPTYLEPGVEVNVELDGSKDFIFLNNNVSPVIMKLNMKGPDLLVELYSIPSEVKAIYEVVEKEIINPRTIYRYSADMKVGQEELIQEGKPGLRVTVIRTISEKKGPFEEREEISRDYYPPTHRIVMKSLESYSKVSDTDLVEGTDLNGDGLVDMNKTEQDNLDPSVNTESGSPNEVKSEVEDLDSFPPGSYYDKAGNIIVPE